MAIEKIATDALDALVDIKVTADYLGDSITDDEHSELEKQAAAALGAIGKTISNLGSKAGKVISDLGGKAGELATKASQTQIGQKLGDQFNKIKNSDLGLKTQDYFKQNGHHIRNGVIGGAALGAVKGALSNYRDPEDHKVHRFRNIMHSAKNGAIIGGAGNAIYSALDYKPSKDVVLKGQYEQSKMDLKGMQQTASSTLEDMYLEKKALDLGSAVTTAFGVASGATKAFGKSTGSMSSRLGAAAMGGLKGGATGAIVSHTANTLLDAAKTKLQNTNQQQAEDPGRFQ